MSGSSPPAATAVRSIWRDPAVRRVALGRGASMLGDVSALTVLTLRVHDAGGGAGGVTALLIAGFLPFVVLLPVTGRLVDRSSRRRVVIGSAVFQAVVAIGLAGATPVPVPVTAALAFALGAGQCVAGAAWQALLVDVVDHERLTPAVGVVQTARTVAGIAGPGVAGLLTATLGTRWPMVALAAVFGLTARLGHRLPAPTVIMSDASRRLDPASVARAEPVGGNWALVSDDPLLRMLLILLGTLIVLTCMDNVVEVFLVRDTLQASSTWFGALASLWAAGMVVGGLTSGWWERPGLTAERGLIRGLLGASLVVVVVLGAFGLVPSVGWLALLAPIGGFANGVMSLVATALVLLRAPAGAAGRISALTSSVTSAAQIGAIALGGGLLSVLAPRPIYGLAGVAGALTLLLLSAPLLRAAGATDAPGERYEVS